MGEETDLLSVRLPVSVLAHLGEDSTARREAAFQALLFEKRLSEHLRDIRGDILVWAAHQGWEYSRDRAEVIAHLVKAGLATEKRSTPRKKNSKK